MKEINGTITLAYVEEDNRQRVIFRVIPLCTREGNVFHGGADDFPDEGSLRIVPDKREQSTFKERMREAGGPVRHPARQRRQRADESAAEPQLCP